MRVSRDCSHLGSLAYIGSDKAVADFSEVGKVTLGGFGAWWLWRSVYWSKQFSVQNRVMIAFDWCKTMIFGRDVAVE